MPVAELISVDEYLSTGYDPDVDYVDGRIEKRNLGERDHGELQFEITAYVNSRRGKTGVRAFLEQRMRVAPNRYRVPDICITTGPKPVEQVFTLPPLAVIEILSPEDRIARMQRKIEDYLDFGVQHVWIVDPESRRVWKHSRGEAREIADRVLRVDDPALTVPLDEIFAAIDEDAAE